MTDRALDEPLPDWRAPPAPQIDVLTGRFCRLERLDPARHSEELHAANTLDDAIWDYMPYGPFSDVPAYRSWADQMAALDDPYFLAIRDFESGRAVGVASFLRVKPAAGSIEVGHINFAPPLQRTRAATEAMYLMMEWIFSAGYRRYEWKCDALNLRSRRSAQRLGFSYEGIFRQAVVVKARNRDTAWFAAIDKEWPVLRAAFQSWLSEDNFDHTGRQKRPLTDWTAPILYKTDPGIAP